MSPFFTSGVVKITPSRVGYTVTRVKNSVSRSVVFCSC